MASPQINQQLLNDTLAALRTRWPKAKPRFGAILGSGWGGVAEALEIRESVEYSSLPALGQSTVEGHSGKLLWCLSRGAEIFLFQGRRHYYEGGGWTPVSCPIFLLKSFGARSVLLTNAAGSTRVDFPPGSLMAITDHLNHFSDHPLIGLHQPFWGERFPDLTAVYDPALRELLCQAAKETKEQLNEGVYCAWSGPSYETPAEVRMLKAWGADAVGMSTVPEAILAHATGLRVAGLSCITNYAAGISPHPLSHREVTETTALAMARIKSLVQRYFELLAENLR